MFFLILITAFFLGVLGVYLCRRHKFFNYVKNCIFLFIVSYPLKIKISQVKIEKEIKEIFFLHELLEQLLKKVLVILRRISVRILPNIWKTFLITVTVSFVLCNIKSLYYISLTIDRNYNIINSFEIIALLYAFIFLYGGYVLEGIFFQKDIRPSATLAFWNVYYIFFILNNCEVLYSIGNSLNAKFNVTFWVYVIFLFYGICLINLIYFLYRVRLFYLIPKKKVSLAKISIKETPKVTPIVHSIKKTKKISFYILEFKKFLVKQKEFSNLELSITMQEAYYFIYAFFKYIFFLLLIILIRVVLGFLILFLLLVVIFNAIILLILIPYHLNEYLSINFHPFLGVVVVLIFYCPIPFGFYLTLIMEFLYS